MIINSQQLEGCRIAALDGAKGRLKDIYFNDQDWSVQYLVISLGGKTNSTDVLLNPEVVSGFNPFSRILKVSLTVEQITSSRAASTVKPVCLQYGIHPGAKGCHSVFRSHSMSPYLRSARAVLGYSMQGQGTNVGELSGFVIDLERWLIHSIVATKEVLNRKLLFSVNPTVVEKISFAAGQVRLKDTNPTVIESIPLEEWMAPADENSQFSSSIV